MTLREPCGDDLDLSGHLGGSKKGLAIRKLTVPATGYHVLEVQPPDGFQGLMRLTVKVKAPKKASGGGPASEGEPLAAVFATLPGAGVTLQVKAARGSAAVPTILSVRDAEGNELLVPAELREKTTSAVLKMTTGVPGGDLTVRLGPRGGSAGEVQWKAKIGEPRGYEFSLDQVASGPR